jgi:hypothetical protein
LVSPRDTDMIGERISKPAVRDGHLNGKVLSAGAGQGTAQYTP